MPSYADKRGRYANAAPWDMNPGTPNAGNRTKTEAKTISAARVPDTYEQNEKGEFVLKPGNKSARDTFRTTTARGQKQANSAVPLQANPAPKIPNGNITATLAKDAHLPTESKALNADIAASSSLTSK
jgi:hypothetical protein